MPEVSCCWQGSQQAMISATEADGRHFMYYTASHGIVLDLDRFDEVTSRRDGLVRYSQDDGCAADPPIL